jgi:COMPASS component SWD1
MGEDPVLIDYSDRDAHPQGLITPLHLSDATTSEADAQPLQQKKAGGRGKADAHITASFNKDGSKIYVGDSHGNITIFDTATQARLQLFRVAGGAGIRSIQFNRSGTNFVINSSDRVIRLFGTETGTQCLQDFKDVVNQLKWKKCCFSCDGDYIIGGSAEDAKHNIYIWSGDGALLKILEGPKEGVLDLAVSNPVPAVVVFLVLETIKVCAACCVPAVSSNTKTNNLENGTF